MRKYSCIAHYSTYERGILLYIINRHHHLTGIKYILQSTAAIATSFWNLSIVKIMLVFHPQMLKYNMVNCMSALFKDVSPLAWNVTTPSTLQTICKSSYLCMRYACSRESSSHSRFIGSNVLVREPNIFIYIVLKDHTFYFASAWHENCTSVYIF